ncbi:MAG TPA: SDR family NAD(P)-dependent oxidoreductase [Caulobacteraceae bacterium]|nr:SDR family NAD(P)-dependent oxidoreductase [Caulobacteraceae bacterium]
MSDHVAGKAIIVTGAAKGFGRLVCEMATARGARVLALDVDAAGLADLAAAGAAAATRIADVTDLSSLKAAAAEAVQRFGAIDVMVNNAGVMPLAFYADHAAATEAWSRCIDINIKGVLNGIVAVHDQMIAQGRGHVINLSSIYGNFPVAGAGVYGATKAAVNFLSDALRAESQGRIKVTTIRPTGVPGTNLGSGIVNPGAIVGILGQNAPGYLGALQGEGNAEGKDPESIRYLALEPRYIAEAILHAIDQPWGVTLSDITVRAAGDQYIL